MSVIWVILNDDKSEIVEVFETESADSVAHWPKFLNHKQGNVFCRKVIRLGAGNRLKETNAWYVNYFYWVDTSRWGYGTPSGIAWSVCLAIPEILKMVEFIE